MAVASEEGAEWKQWIVGARGEWRVLGTVTRIDSEQRNEVKRLTGEEQILAVTRVRCAYYSGVREAQWRMHICEESGIKNRKDENLLSL